MQTPDKGRLLPFFFPSFLLGPSAQKITPKIVHSSAPALTKLCQKQHPIGSKIVPKVIVPSLGNMFFFFTPKTTCTTQPTPAQLPATVGLLLNAAVRYPHTPSVTTLACRGGETKNRKKVAPTTRGANTLIAWLMLRVATKQCKIGPR